MKLYPNSDVDEKGPFMSIFIFNEENSGDECNLTYRFEIISGSKTVKTRFQETTMPVNDFKESGYGEHEFIYHEDLFENMHLYVSLFGNLKIACEVNCSSSISIFSH